MLSQEERRRLEEIERHLRDSDPGFAARMRAEPEPVRRRVHVLWGFVAVAVLLLAAVAWLSLAAVGPLLVLLYVLLLHLIGRRGGSTRARP